MKITKKEKIERKINKLTNELFNIEYIEERKKLKPFLGKYFKYENSYSGPKEGNCWYLYLKAEKMYNSNTINTIEVITFQKDIYGKIEIEKKKWTYNMIKYCKEITEDEYYNEFKKINIEIHNIIGA